MTLHFYGLNLQLQCQNLWNLILTVHLSTQNFFENTEELLQIFDFITLILAF